MMQAEESAQISSSITECPRSASITPDLQNNDIQASSDHHEEILPETAGPEASEGAVTAEEPNGENNEGIWVQDSSDSRGSESDVENSENGSDDPWTTTMLYNDYKRQVIHDRTRKSRDGRQERILVRALVDYLSLLENRLLDLEAGYGVENDEVPEKVAEQQEREAPPFEVTVKFFNLLPYFKDDGSYTHNHDQWEERTASEIGRDHGRYAVESPTTDQHPPATNGPIQPPRETEALGNDNIPVYDRPDALPHFQAFVEFVDLYLADHLRLYERLREGKEQHVAFENLWILFEMNDTIYRPLPKTASRFGNHRYNQGREFAEVPRYSHHYYRVSTAIGGMPLMKIMVPTPDSENVDKLEDLLNPLMSTRIKTLAGALERSPTLE
ncbi:hypothetical protein B0H66DRAFT_609592 [Apodospora peruviana]|uniref:Uncharacterized protein n=1 Tax=Apodospora peruviana TaxID=516989 RepID=A0AAE0IQ48_9PEZI|nr:hypothetical protein B0H66DRAFT_609592 [Apodospora peruviana]